MGVMLMLMLMPMLMLMMIHSFLLPLYSPGGDIT
jgi:hypothetical protein